VEMRERRRSQVMRSAVTWANVRGQRKCVATARDERGKIVARVTIVAKLTSGRLTEDIAAEARQIVERLARRLERA
jgi:hypothetical protein